MTDKTVPRQRELQNYIKWLRECARNATTRNLELPDLYDDFGRGPLDLDSVDLESLDPCDPRLIRLVAQGELRRRRAN